MTQDEINKMTGADNYNKPQLTRRTAIRINGKKGGIILTYLAEPKGEDGYRQETLNDPISVVFLKIRRRLMQGSKDDGVIKSTTEHDVKTDEVTLFIKEGQKSEVGRADALREKYPELKTEQVVYVRYKGEVCKLSVKGTSLRGDEKEKTINFYQYITANPDWYKFQTRLVPAVTEDGYHYLKFERGADLSEEQLEAVIENIKEVHENCTAVDEAYRKSGGAAPAQADQRDLAVVPEYDYPEEEIVPSDIPW